MNKALSLIRAHPWLAALAVLALLLWLRKKKRAAVNAAAVTNASSYDDIPDLPTADEVDAAFIGPKIPLGVVLND